MHFSSILAQISRRLNEITKDMLEITVRNGIDEFNLVTSRFSNKVILEKKKNYYLVVGQ